MFVRPITFSLKIRTEWWKPVLESALCSKSLEFSFPCCFFLSQFPVNVSIFLHLFYETALVCYGFSLEFCIGNWCTLGQNLYPRACPMFNRCACTISRTLFCSLVSHHPRQARQIKAKEAEIIGLWNGLKVNFNSVFCFNKDERE